VVRSLSMNIIQLKIFLANFVSIAGNLLTYAIFIRVILSWFRVAGGAPPGKLIQIINGATDPIMNLIKKLPHKIGMIDLSPIIALFGISMLTSFLVKLIAGI